VLVSPGSERGYNSLIGDGKPQNELF